MNWRIYLMVLRPWSALFGVAVYTFLGAGMTPIWFHASGPTTLFLTTAIVLPLLVGGILTYTILVQLHQPTFLLLPAGLRRWRRATTIAAVICSSAVATLVSIVAPAVPFLASFGLAAGLMTLFFPNRHRFAMGIFWSPLLFALWITFNLTFASSLPAAMIAAPWLFFLGGLTLAAGCISFGLSNRHLRSRTETQCVHFMGTDFNVLFDRRLQAQLRDRHARTIQQKNQYRPAPPGQNWKIKQVRPAITDWMQVIWHAAYSNRQRGAWRRVHFIYGIVALLLFLLLPLLNIPMNRLLGTSPATSTTDYWDTLAIIGSPIMKRQIHPGVPLKFSDMLSLLAHSSLASMIFMLTPLPQLAYPISRRRMVKIVFALTLRQLVTALLFSTAIMLFVSWLGQIVTGHFLPAGSNAGTGAVALLLAIMLPQIACASMTRSLFVRLVWGVVSVGGTMCAGFAVSLLADHFFNPWGIFCSALAIGASVGLLWWRLQQHYCRNDLVFEKGLFGSGTAPMK